VTLYDRENVHPCRTVTVDGGAVKHLRPAERELGALLLRLLLPPDADGNPRKLTKTQRKGKGSRHPRHIDGAHAAPHMTAEEIAAQQERSRRCLVGMAASLHTFEQSVRAAVLATEGVAAGSPALIMLLDEAAPLIDAPESEWRAG
jgi:hypothetical protein